MVLWFVVCSKVNASEFPLENLSTEEKVGQLMMVGFSGQELTEEMRYWIEQRHIGGVVLFSRNIANLEQTAKLIRDLQAIAKIPLFIALDQEGGTVMRVKEGALPLPGNMALGATRDPLLAYVAGQALAIDLRRIGFNMNFAPVLDVNTNPKNPVIGIRSYGENPELVGLLGSWYIRGQQEMGVVAVAKHFPGHGDADADSHFRLPTILASKKRFETIELPPFKQAMAVDVDAMMTAHIAVPNLAENQEIPATLSYAVLTHLLRKQMHFKGLVLTDGLEMQGLSHYGVAEAAVKSVLAGADMPMVLWNNKAREETYQALLAAVKNGALSQKRLRTSVDRILNVKQHRGFFSQSLIALNDVVKQKQNVTHTEISQQIAKQSITLVRNHGDVLPIRKSRYRNVVVMAPKGELAERLKQSDMHLVEVAQTIALPERVALAKELIQRSAQADLIVFAVQNRYHLRIAKAVLKAAPYIPSVLISLASPYDLQQMPDVDAFVCAYGALPVSQIALADALLGNAPMQGKLPISIPGFYPYGHYVYEQLLSQVE